MTELVQRVVNFPEELDEELRQISFKYNLSKNDFIRGAVRRQLELIKFDESLAIKTFEAGMLSNWN